MCQNGMCQNAVPGTKTAVQAAALYLDPHHQCALRSHQDPSFKQIALETRRNRFATDCDASPGPDISSVAWSEQVNGQQGT